MLKIYKRIRQTLTHSLLAVAAASPALLAQGLGSTPYSALGVGELYSPAHIANMGMGGVGISNASAFYLNLQNPALLARRTRFTIFEVGLAGQSRTLSQTISNAEHIQRNVAGNLSYLALAFPVSSRSNVSLSLKPYTYVNYNTRQVQQVPGTHFPTLYNYTGSGGLNKASLSGGYRIGKNIYAGVEASFLFGNITRSSSSQVFTGSQEDLKVNLLNRTNYSDVVFKLGAAWRPKLGEKWNLNIGATYDPQTQVSASQTSIYQQTTSSGQALALPDTLRLNSNGFTALPQQLHFGISAEKGNSLMVGVDVGFQKWSQYRTLDNKPGNLTDVMNVAAGVEYTPKPTSSRYRDLITYRAGFQYNQMPYTVAGQAINDINGSLGLSLPLGSYFVNHVSLSVVGGQRGLLTSNQIQERYVRVALGFSLNDWWFVKRVVD